jgi:iron complex outermembrane receptor protein
LDFGVLNNRLSGTLDFYYRKTTNLLNTVAIPAGTNYNNELLTNVGTLENRGVELTLTAHPITTKDWDWTLSYNVAYNKNEITRLTFNDDPNYVGVIHTGIDGATGYNIMINAVNRPYNSFYVFQQTYDANGVPVENAYVDQNGDNKIDEKDLIPYKKAAPDVFMGLTSQLSYKQWDFSFALRASIGNWAYNNVQSNREAYDGAQMYDPSGFLKNRVESAWKTDFVKAQFRSSYYVQNASFVRMDNITLGYTFDKVFTDKLRARLYATVQNPFVITRYSGLDPEFNGGVDNNIYPRPRTYMIGFTLNY